MKTCASRSGGIAENPLIPHKNVRGFVYDVEDGSLREVQPS